MFQRGRGLRGSDVARAAAACTQSHDSDVHIPLCVHAAICCAGAAAVGAPGYSHKLDRFWHVAWPHDQQLMTIG